MTEEQANEQEEAPQDATDEAQGDEEATEEEANGDGADANGDADDEEAVVLGDEFQTIDEASQDDTEEGNYLPFLTLLLYTLE